MNDLPNNEKIEFVGKKSKGCDTRTKKPKRRESSERMDGARFMECMLMKARLCKRKSRSRRDQLPMWANGSLVSLEFATMPEKQSRDLPLRHVTDAPNC